MASGSITFAVFNNILRGLGGEVPIAAFGVVFRVISFFFLPIVGISQGAQPIIGFNFGAQQLPRVRRGLCLANLSATAVSLIGLLSFLIFPEPIFRIFSTDPELIGMGKDALRILAFGLPMVGYQTVGTSLFQALGKARPALFLALMRQLLFTIPLVLVLPRILGLNGVWLSFPAADTIAFLVTLAMVTYVMRHLSAQERLPIKRD
jgi:Na+-driven multidrug efflux pump